MKNSDSAGHVTGRSVFLDDIPEISGTLYAVPVASDIAHGRILKIDFLAALAIPGVVKIITYKDIPGENQIGSIIPDEPLLSPGDLHFVGQPVALVVATSEMTARKARNLIHIETEKYEPVTDARQAHKLGHFLVPPRVFTEGDIRKAWQNCTYIFEGTAGTGAQEHVYLETQGAIAWITENGSVTVHSATQGPTVVQKTVAKVLGLPMNRVEVDVRRLGGGFGGKEDQATTWAALTALAAFVVRKPVKLVLSRHDDMVMTGKRHPYSSDFKIGFSADLKILAWEVTYYQNGGASADLSPAILERTLFHSTNSYFIPNVKATAYSCRTNLPPNTAFRGFGAPQAMFVIESAIALAAAELNVPAYVIQEKNLVDENDIFPYGQKVMDASARACWAQTRRYFDIESKIAEIETFNASGNMLRKGLSVMPVCFGISFTNTPMNQARALVHIYQDGSIGISTGAVEMGQGVNTRLIQVAATAFSVDPQRVKMETTNTTRVANTSPTAASSAADLNGKAIQVACDHLLERLKKVASQMTGADAGSIEISNEMVLNGGKITDIGWERLIGTAFLQRENLSQSAHYATPEIYFDKSKEKGHPFAYYVFGTAITVVTLDCLRGEYLIESVNIVHDSGNNMNRDLDLSQIEGAVLQGIGWMTMEEIRYSETGKLLADSLSTYKIPDIHSVPKAMSCEFLPSEGSGLAIMGSKAVGEPPLMYGIGTYFALQNAMKAFHSDMKLSFDAPLTPEKILMALYKSIP
jgi:xanthine dehydrogenase large subunit